MNRSNIDTVFEEVLGSPAASLSPLGGGSISSAFKVLLRNGESYFAKTDPQYDDMFIKEANGLNEIRSSSTLRVPKTIFADRRILILELLPVASPSNRNNFFEDFGRRFARMHRFSDSTYGFFEDNFIRIIFRSEDYVQFSCLLVTTSSAGKAAKN